MAWGKGYVFQVTPDLGNLSEEAEPELLGLQQFPQAGRWPESSTATRLHPLPRGTGHETITAAHSFSGPHCFTRMRSKIKLGGYSSNVFLDLEKATDFLLACPWSKQPKGLPHVFPSQSCLQSFVLPSGTFLPSISSDVWRYFGISTLFLEVFQSTSTNDCSEGQH